jgi:hypothetical protein
MHRVKKNILAINSQIDSPFMKQTHSELNEADAIPPITKSIPPIITAIENKSISSFHCV